jgi:hypothetical protein
MAGGARGFSFMSWVLVQFDAARASEPIAPWAGFVNRFWERAVQLRSMLTLAAEKRVTFARRRMVSREIIVRAG